MARLLLTALVIALIVALLALAARSVANGAGALRARVAGPDGLGETPMQRLSFVLLVALVFYAALWGGA